MVSEHSTFFCFKKTLILAFFFPFFLFFPPPTMTSEAGIEHSVVTQPESMFTEFTTKITKALSKIQTPTMTTEPPAAPIGIKLNGTNYALWSQVVEMYISGKDKLGYINGDLPQPPAIDPFFRKWRTDNAIVKGWLIN